MSVVNRPNKNFDNETKEHIPYSVMMTGIEDYYITLTLEPKINQSMIELESAVSDFCNEVLDQQIRLNLEKRNGRIRELIVEHAFSPLADLKSRLEQIK